MVDLPWHDYLTAMNIAPRLSQFNRPTSERSDVIPSDVEEAVRTLLRWAGDDPDREGLIDTPRRVARAWQEYCRGYVEDLALHLECTFEEAGGYEDIVL